MAKSLVVWMNGLKVGVWKLSSRSSTTFQYENEWIESAEGRPISLSLPFAPNNEPHRGDVVTHYFDNLLPDSNPIRSRIRSRYATSSTHPFDLLAAIGRDCVGAVQLLPEGAEPKDVHRIKAQPLSNAGVEKAINACLQGGLIRDHGDEEFRISIAGAQEKTALLYHRGKWWKPLGSTPTTHIMKLPLGLIGNQQFDMKDSVENEWLCMRLLHHLGLNVPKVNIQTFGDRKVLVVERFDRAWQNGKWIARLPQEDFCQALGLPSSKKYETDGGPTMDDIFRVLDASSKADEDKKDFFKAQIIFWLLAAVDGHAKNFSIFHERGGSYRLTPFYDVLSAWPLVGSKGMPTTHKLTLAMAVRSKSTHRRLREIKLRHWDAVAKRHGLVSAKNIVHEIQSSLPNAIESAQNELSKDFPARVATSIFNGLLNHSKLLHAQMK